MKKKNVQGDRMFSEADVKAFNEKTPTWTAVCPVCNVALTGTLKELKEHKHDKSCR